MTEIKAYAILLTPEEALAAKNLGYAYVKAHMADAVELPLDMGDRIYDRGCSYFIYNDVSYLPYRDFTILGTDERYFLCRPSTQRNDIIEPEPPKAEEKEEEGEGIEDEGEEINDEPVVAAAPKKAAKTTAKKTTSKKTTTKK